MRELDGNKIADTARLLRDRIFERFPESGLGRIVAETTTIAEHAWGRSRTFRRVNWLVRGPIILLLISLVVVVVYGASHLEVERSKLTRFSSVLQILDAAMATILVMGGLILFLWSLEARLKRRQALRALHELRSLAHIVDMHQLTKDPERLQKSHIATESSPKLHMSPFELGRYLDYCREGLSIIGKIAALYSEGLDDATVLNSVDQVETLTTSLGRKIWQKERALNELFPDAVSPDA